MRGRRRCGTTTGHAAACGSARRRLGALRLGGDEHDPRAGIARAASGIKRGRSACFVGDRDHQAASGESEPGLERIAAGECRVGKRVGHDGLSRAGGMFTGATAGEQHRFASVGRLADV